MWYNDREYLHAFGLQVKPSKCDVMHLSSAHFTFLRALTTNHHETYSGIVIYYWGMEVVFGMLSFIKIIIVQLLWCCMRGYKAKLIANLLVNDVSFSHHLCNIFTFAVIVQQRLRET